MFTERRRKGSSEMETRTLIHTRAITINTYDTGSDTISVEGELKDIQPLPWYFYTTGEFREPGYSHRISAQLTVDLPEMVITGTDAQMDVVAHDDCKQAQRLIGSIVGLSLLEKDLKKKILTFMGGTRGCIHLTALVLEIASAGVQGLWGFYNRVENGSLIMAPEYDPSLLLNSCLLWREGSPFAQKIPHIEDEIARHKNALKSIHQLPEPEGT